MFLAIVTEEVDELGRKRYVARLGDLGEEKPYGMLGLGDRWTHKELAILVMNRHDLDKAAELLGRTRESCKKKLYRLGISLRVNVEKKPPPIMMIFPREQIDRRKVVVKQVLPRLKKLLKQIDKSNELVPENINDLAKVVRAVAALLNAVERWQTGDACMQYEKKERIVEALTKLMQRRIKRSEDTRIPSV